jgi:hypothetical protein
MEVGIANEIVVYELYDGVAYGIAAVAAMIGRNCSLASSLTTLSTPVSYNSRRHTISIIIGTVIIDTILRSLLQFRPPVPSSSDTSTPCPLLQLLLANQRG